MQASGSLERSVELCYCHKSLQAKGLKRMDIHLLPKYPHVLETDPRTFSAFLNYTERVTKEWATTTGYHEGGSSSAFGPCQ